LATFGELGEYLKDYVQSYQLRSATHQPSAINSIADMKRFVEEYPEFQRLGGNVSKHVALVGELSRLVERDQLLEVGECEQGLATSSGSDVKVCLKDQFDSSFSLSTPRQFKQFYSTTPYPPRLSCGWSCFMRCIIKKRPRQPTLVP
jgi:Sec1 family